MPRISSISIEEVAEIAGLLFSNGTLDPSAGDIRKVLEKRRKDGEIGSLSTIQRHLDAWRLNVRPKPATLPIQVPPQLLAEIGRVLTAVETSTRQKGEEVTSRIQSELDAHVEDGEILETRLRHSQEKLSAITSLCDSRGGQLSLKTTEAAELKRDLEQSRANESDMSAKLQISNLELRMERVRNDERRDSSDREIARLSAELATCRQELGISKDRMAESEKALAASDALLEASREARTVLTSHIEDLRQRQACDGAVKDKMQTRLDAQEASILRLKDDLSLASNAAAVERAELLHRFLTKPAPAFDGGAASPSRAVAEATAVESIRPATVVRRHDKLTP